MTITETEAALLRPHRSAGCRRAPGWRAGAFYFTAPLDNREPWHRNHQEWQGRAVVYERDGGEGWALPTITIEAAFGHPGTPKDSTRATFLIDDGRSVLPYYVAGWNEAHREVFLHPYPVNVWPDGSSVMRADNRGPVDYSNWSIGPRRTYHLKVTQWLPTDRYVARAQ